VNDQKAAWVEAAAQTAQRAVADRDDLLALVVSAVRRHDPFVIPVPRRSIEAAAPRGELRSAIERHQSAFSRSPITPPEQTTTGGWGEWSLKPLSQAVAKLGVRGWSLVFGVISVRVGVWLVCPVGVAKWPPEQGFYG